MPVVVSDTGPLHYLILIGHVEILRMLFGAVTIPDAVRVELDRPTTPQPVRAWIASAPPWLAVKASLSDNDATLSALDLGERSVIALSDALRADLVLMDERAGVAVARAKGFVVTGTLGLLDLGARRGMLDLAAAFAALGATNFHISHSLIDTLLAQHAARQL